MSSSAEWSGDALPLEPLALPAPALPPPALARSTLALSAREALLDSIEPVEEQGELGVDRDRKDVSPPA